MTRALDLGPAEEELLAFLGALRGDVAKGVVERPARHHPADTWTLSRLGAEVIS